MANVSPELASLSLLLELEARARSAATEKELEFFIVNETRRLLSYRQAYLFLASHDTRRECTLTTASSVAVIDKTAPFTRWIEAFVADVLDYESIVRPRFIDAAACPEHLKAGWKEFSLPFVIWCPLMLGDETFVGGLWLARETQWKDNELALCRRLAATYAHALVALVGRKRIHRTPRSVRLAAWILIGFVMMVLVKPIRLATLAPVEVVARSPVIISSPMDGVVRDIVYPPNTLVNAGDTILLFEDTNLRNEYLLAEKTLAVSNAEYRKLSQGAFEDIRSKAQIGYVRSQVDLHTAEVEYARELLEKAVVKAPESGILIYTDKSDWIGRPVLTGERIMEIADPDRIQLKIELPVRDAIVLEKGAAAEVFLDAAPLHPFSAQLTRTSYKAEISEQDILSFRLYARFKDEDPQQRSVLRIGLRGTAKVYGERVSLFFFLFRRPISYLRQLLGI